MGELISSTALNLLQREQTVEGVWSGCGVAWPPDDVFWRRASALSCGAVGAFVLPGGSTGPAALLHLDDSVFAYGTSAHG